MTAPSDPGAGNSVWRGLRGDAIWQMAERATRVGFGFIVSVVGARILGPENYGLYTYALAVVALFAFLGQAGLDALLLRELVNAPDRSAQILGDGATLRLLGAALAAIASIAVATFDASTSLRPASILVAILVLAGFFQAGWVVDSLLQANRRFRDTALAKIVAYGVSAALRLIALRLDHPLIALAAITVFESALAAFLMWRASRRKLHIGISTMRLPDPHHLRALARLAAPMLLSALTVAIYSRIDVFMLGRMAGTRAAGLYGAGSLLSEGFYLIPMALMAAAAPRLTQLYRQDQPAFERGLHRLLRGLSATGLGIAVATTCLAPWIVPVVFGAEYTDAVTILQIHVWSTWAVFVSVASDPWYINHDLRSQYLAKTSAAAVINVLLNFLWIPRWQGAGAAAATVVAYLSSAIAVGAFWPQTRPLLRLQIRAILGLQPRPTMASPSR